MALQVWYDVQETFWSRHFWLPNNVTWDVFNDDTMFLPKPRDLWAPFPLAVGLCFLRLLWERFVAYPIGRIYKLSERPPRKPVHSEILEDAFKAHKKRLPDHKILQGYAKQTDWSVRQIERWWRLRRIVNKPSEMQRFRETSWRFLFYLIAFWYGFFVLIQKPWFWDTKHCWYGWPKQEVTPELYWYYMIELGFYWSLVISVIIDNKRKDFWEMVVHHIATIALMMFSWANNMIRVGTLVLCVHDAVDYWMEGAKIANYLKYGRLCDALFVVFTVVWFFTRIVIFPLRIIHCTLNEGHHMLGICPIYYVYNILLITLQVLHIIWFISILRMVHQYVIKGKVGSYSLIQGSRLVLSHFITRRSSTFFHVWTPSLVKCFASSRVIFFFSPFSITVDQSPFLPRILHEECMAAHYACCNEIIYLANLALQCLQYFRSHANT